VNCLACGHRNPERAKFCLECGTALQLRCTQCQTELPAGARFCLECGTPVTAASAAAGAGSAAAAPERSPADYTPKHLADKILQSRSAL
jgi:ribosomal protein L40E